MGGAKREEVHLKNKRLSNMYLCVCICIYIYRSIKLPESVVDADVVIVHVMVTSGGAVWNCPVRM